MSVTGGGFWAVGSRIAAGLIVVLAVGCSGGGDGPTGSDLPKDDTVWVRVSTDGIVPILTVHASRVDAMSGGRPAGVAGSPMSDSEPTLYAFRNVEPYEPDVTGWTIRLESNPSVSGVCAQEMPKAASPLLTLCAELEPISVP